MTHIVFHQEDGLEKRHYLYDAGMGIIGSFFGTKDEFRKHMARRRRQDVLAVVLSTVATGLLFLLLYLSGSLK